MKSFALIISAIVFFVSLNIFASNAKIHKHSIIEVITPSHEIYDSGMYRILYKSFYIVDKDDQKVVSCGDVFDTAAKVKLTEGSYTIFYQDLNGNIQQKAIKIESNVYLQLVLN